MNNTKLLSGLILIYFACLHSPQIAWTQLPVYPVGEQDIMPTPRNDSIDNNGYRISQEFHNDDHHTGVDLVNTPKGTLPTAGGEVRAIFEGTVVLALPEQLSSNFGNMVMIGHIFPDGVFYSLYGHFEGPSSKKPCDTVETGTKIGYVGNTGKSTAPHLHLGIKTKGILGCGYLSDECNSERAAGFNNYAPEGPLQFIANRREGSPTPSLPPSTAFTLNERVQTTTDLNTRCFPNNDLPETKLGVQTLGSLGTIVDGPVFTNDLWWWKIDYDNGSDGWSAEEFLESESFPDSDVEDVWITSHFDYGDDFGVDNEELQVGGWGDFYHTLIKFDLTGLPSNVTSAEIQLYAYPRGDNSTPVSMRLDRVDEAWDEDTGWFNAPSATPIGTLPVPTVDEWFIIDITDLYNDWKDGSRENHGIQLRPTGNDNQFNVFRSSEYVDENFRPKLVVTP